MTLDNSDLLIIRGVCLIKKMRFHAHTPIVAMPEHKSDKVFQGSLHITHIHLDHCERKQNVILYKTERSNENEVSEFWANTSSYKREASTVTGLHFVRSQSQSDANWNSPTPEDWVKPLCL